MTPIEKTNALAKRQAPQFSLSASLGQGFLECRVKLCTLACEATPLQAIKLVADGLLDSTATIGKLLFLDEVVQPSDDVSIESDGNSYGGHR
jgi:hypothetical protein